MVLARTYSELDDAIAKALTTNPRLQDIGSPTAVTIFHQLKVLCLAWSTSNPIELAICSSGSNRCSQNVSAKQYDDLIDYIESFRAELPDASIKIRNLAFRVYLVPKINRNRHPVAGFVKYDRSKTGDMPLNIRCTDQGRQVQVANQSTYISRHTLKLVWENRTNFQKRITIHWHGKCMVCVNQVKPGRLWDKVLSIWPSTDDTLITRLGWLPSMRKLSE